MNPGKRAELLRYQKAYGDLAEDKEGQKTFEQIQEDNKQRVKSKIPLVKVTN